MDTRFYFQMNNRNTSTFGTRHKIWGKREETNVYIQIIEKKKKTLKEYKSEQSERIKIRKRKNNNEVKVFVIVGFIITVHKMLSRCYKMEWANTCRTEERGNVRTKWI